MRMVKDILRDMLVAVAIGLGVGVALVLLFALIGGAANGLQGALEASRGAVLIVGGLLLLFSGILMLKGGNLPPDAFSLRPWKKQDVEDVRDEVESTEPLRIFRRLPRQYAFALMAAGILMTSLIPESVVLYYL